MSMQAKPKQEMPVFQIRAKPVLSETKNMWNPAIQIIVDGVPQNHIINQNTTAKKKRAFTLSTRMAEHYLATMSEQVYHRLMSYAQSDPN